MATAHTTMPSERRAPRQSRRKASAYTASVEHEVSLLHEASLDVFAGAFRSEAIGRSRIVHADCFEWLATLPESSLHAIITDPPYGVKEYDTGQLAKRARGSGGVWRIPPSFDGHTRSPLPRFTALNEKERATLQQFFAEWGG